MDVILLQLLLNDGIIVPKNETIIIGLVLKDTHLGIHIILEVIMVTIQVIGCDIKKNSYVCTEVIHVVKLERT